MLDEIVKSSALSKKKTMKTQPSSATVELLTNKEKRPTTKVMVHKALVDLKTRKGVSLYAIKKYMEDNYNVDMDKTKHLIKKTITAGVEQGSIIQVKGVGTLGSFKLGDVKQKTEKKKKPIKTAATKEKLDDVVEKAAKLKKTTEEKHKTSQKKVVEKAAKKKNDQKMQKAMKSTTTAVDKRAEKTKLTKSKMAKSKTAKSKTAKSKTAKGVKTKDVRTPTKKLMSIMKRKSIGSVIKQPKMKPGKV